MICAVCGKPKLPDTFAGEGGAGKGYMDAGFCVTPVDTSKERLANYPALCPGTKAIRADAVAYTAEHGHKYAVIHASPTCTGYSQGTVALPDRLTRYDRLIGVTREALLMTGRPYIIENVYGARRELRNPVMLCGRMFGLGATDTDGTHVVLDRHRMFEANMALMVPEHVPHGWQHNRLHGIQVAGAYGGARRDKYEAKYVRKGGYVPSVEVQRVLLGTPWMSEQGCKLSIPPAYSEFIGSQLLTQLEAAA